MSNQHLSEQEIIRREKLAELQRLGIDPYPAALYPVSITAATIKSTYKGEENRSDFADVCLAGRIMSVRDMGKASFAVIQDSSGRIQLYIKRDEICKGDDKTLYDKVWKHLLDIGDFIGQIVHAKILKIDESRHNIVISRRKMIEEAVSYTHLTLPTILRV